MCSILGVLEFEETFIDKTALLEKALTILSNRGPDEQNISEINSYCCMSGNRLIIRGSYGIGSMPFKYNNALCYYNGEIYNYKKWSKGISSDGEIILPLYEKYDVNFLQFIEGEFAISIWDDNKKCLILATDPFGSKPIYFSLSNQKLIWASSESAINEILQHEYCAITKSNTFLHSQSIQTPYTSFSGIWRIPPGHFILANKENVNLYCYNYWKEGSYSSRNTKLLFRELENSLISRLNFNGTIAIPLSAGIDSGIIAFIADRLGIKYHIFSLVEMFGYKTVEAKYIYERLDKLKHAQDITLLSCNETEYWDALSEIYSNDYYISEKYDGGAIPMHTVVKAIHTKGLKVLIDGTGGDELFHGYTFRKDFKPVDEFPMFWKRNYYYSIPSTLVDFASKSDLAGAHFSIETRYPFLSRNIYSCISNLIINDTLKWPLRKYLLENTHYGKPNEVDRQKKFGFMLERIDRWEVVRDMKLAWLKANKLNDHPNLPALKFPFKIGLKVNL